MGGGGEMDGGGLGMEVGGCRGSFEDQAWRW